MKSVPAKRAALPPVRVEPQLRKAAESVLAENESLSSLIESALRTEIAHRQARTAFLKRGIEAGKRARETDQWRSVDEVLSGLQSILTQAQQGATS